MILNFASARHYRLELLRLHRGFLTPATQELSDFIHVKVNNRGCVKRQDLRDEQTANNRNPKRLAQLRSCALLNSERERTEKGGHRCHHDRAKTQQTGLVDRFLRSLALFPLSIERKVNHHDRVLLNDPDQQNYSNQSDK